MSWLSFGKGKQSRIVFFSDQTNADGNKDVLKYSFGFIDLNQLVLV